MKVKICDPEAFYDDQWTVVEEFSDLSMMDSILEFPTFPVYDGLLIKIHRAYSGVYMDGKFRNLCMKFTNLKPRDGGKSWIDRWRDCEEPHTMFCAMDRIVLGRQAVKIAFDFILREIEYRQTRDFSEEAIMALGELNAVVLGHQVEIFGNYFQPSLERGFQDIFYCPNGWLHRSLSSAIYIVNKKGNLENFALSFGTGNSVRHTKMLREMIPIRELCKMLLNSNASDSVRII